MTQSGKGVAAIIAACTIWGLSPIFYKQVAHIPAIEVLAHRVWWSLVLFVLILTLQSRLGDVRAALSTWRNFALIALAACMISVNWFLFIFAIQIERTTEASLGYFIYPLVAVLIGRFGFRERLGVVQWGAVALAAGAVGVLTYGLGVAPWISLALACTFALYSTIKKGLDTGPVVSVTCEILLFSPLALAVIVTAQMGGQGGFATNMQDTVLLVLSGPVTAVPLILFSYAAKRIAMSTLGLIAYLNPVLQFFCAVILFGEPFGPWHAIAFPMIWIALALYSISALVQDRTARRASISSAGVALTETKPASDASAKP
ncbi:EamA family transporter RarD [Sulfitobacter sp. JL08]|uniref:EamA family transporter RarD n=1 Tax=Sulfitobacter sp. JL08 TaxID=2070369 RepID=UPI000E0B212E|nr:EamA family transporter RarD [Sulfitobacter sp. JL08]AXI56889.1 EamA family transporter RarD [Sulfitobacter sp. JL08]